MIRAARGKDVPRIAEIARAAYARYVPVLGFEPPPMIADFAADIDDTAVFDDGILCGYVVRYVQPERVYLENVAVDPARAGQGVGGALIRHVEAEALALGLPVELHTNEKMTANLSIYPAMGYAETGRRTEHGLHRVFFRKSLDRLTA